MNTIGLIIKKTWFIILIGAFCVASVPLSNVAALSASEPATPPAPFQNATQRLEQGWAREQKINGKLTTFFSNVDQRIAQGQELIDKAKAKGKNTSSLQSALDAFSAAVKQAEPIFQSTQSDLTSHAGFDENGKVTDSAQAFTTVISLGEKYREIRQLLMEPGKALRDAIKTFRSENAPPTPASSSQGDS